MDLGLYHLNFDLQVDHLSVQSIPTWELAGSWPVLPLGVLGVLVSSVPAFTLMLPSSPIGSDQSFVNIHPLSASARPRAMGTVTMVTGAGLDKRHPASRNLSCSSQMEIALALMEHRWSHSNRRLLKHQLLKLQNHSLPLLLHQHQVW